MADVKGLGPIGFEELLQLSSISSISKKAEQKQCWGSQLTGKCCDTEGFTAGVGHFKQKFCPSCLRDGVYLDASHVRAITAGADESLNNPSSAGAWAETAGGIEYRLINQTAKCFGPAMLVARDADTAETLARTLSLPAAPEEYSRDGYLHLVVAKGTLVPAQQKVRGQKRFASGDPPAEMKTLEGFSAPFDEGLFDLSRDSSVSDNDSFTSKVSAVSSNASTHCVLESKFSKYSEYSIFGGPPSGAGEPILKAGGGWCAPAGAGAPPPIPSPTLIPPRIFDWSDEVKPPPPTNNPFVLRTEPTAPPRGADWCSGAPPAPEPAAPTRAESLLRIASSHALLSTQIQECLQEAADETDPAFVAYRKSLEGLIEPLLKAGEALRAAKESKPVPPVKTEEEYMDDSSMSEGPEAGAAFDWQPAGWY